MYRGGGGWHKASVQGGGDSWAGEKFRGECRFSGRYRNPPPESFCAIRAMSGPRVGSYHFPSAERYWCPCVACQHQPLCHGVSPRETPSPPPPVSGASPPHPHPTKLGQAPTQGVTRGAAHPHPNGACASDTHRHGSISLSPAPWRGSGIVSSLGGCETRQRNVGTQSDAVG